MKIHKGDTVHILSGKDRAKSGKVLSVDRETGTAFVEGVNLYKKHRKPRRQGEKGEIIVVPRPVRLSKLMLVCSHCGKPTRVNVIQEAGVKARRCKKCRNKI